MDLNFVRGQFTEAELEKAIITLFEEQDYKYVCGNTTHRKYEDVLIKDDLRVYLTARYPDLTASETERTIGLLENIPSVPLYHGNREDFMRLFAISSGQTQVKSTCFKINHTDKVFYVFITTSAALDFLYAAVYTFNGT